MARLMDRSRRPGAAAGSPAVLEAVAKPFSGYDAGRDGTGLRLTAMGRIRDAHGVDLCTVWCILNASTRARTVTLYAPQVTGRVDTSYRREWTLAPCTQLYVHSPIVAWPATHLLSEGVRLIDVGNPRAIDFVAEPLEAGSGRAAHAPAAWGHDDGAAPA